MIKGENESKKGKIWKQQVQIIKKLNDDFSKKTTK